MGHGAALAADVGFVLQQQRAPLASTPAGLLSIGMVRDLLGRPRWLVGIAAMVVGQILSAIALGMGDSALVEPTSAAMVLFALIIAAIWRRQPLDWREPVGVMALAPGVAGFVIAARPFGSQPDQIAALPPLVAVAVVAGVVLILTRGRLRLLPRATAIGVATGILFGTQDALTRRALVLLSSGPAQMLGDFSPYLAGCRGGDRHSARAGGIQDGTARSLASGHGQSLYWSRPRRW